MLGNIEVLKFSSIFEIHYSTLKLTSDNKFESNYNLDSGVETETGTWSTSENVLTIAFDPGGSETFEFSLDGDQYNPDVFPVDPLVGTDEDFRIILEAAHDAGHFNMPYLNVTIWDDESETVQSLAIEDFASMQLPGEPAYECYSGHCLYAVCPYAPAVIERLQHLMEQEIKVKIPADIVWEDQMSRYTLDWNKHMPDPAHTAQGWLEHARRYKHLNLMAEHTHDRMVENHVGIKVNLLLYESTAEDLGYKAWGTGTWEYFPIVPIMARDKVFFYTGPHPPVDNKQQLTWAMAMGQMLSYQLRGSTYNTTWHKTTQAFQQFVVARYANERMLEYARVSEDVTRSSFENYEILTNWSKVQTLAVNDHTITTEGFIVTNNAENLTAGIFTRYNGQNLSSGDHYIIKSCFSDSIVIRHPQGSDTPIKMALNL